MKAKLESQGFFQHLFYVYITYTHTHTQIRRFTPQKSEVFNRGRFADCPSVTPCWSVWDSQKFQVTWRSGNWVTNFEFYTHQFLDSILIFRGVFLLDFVEILTSDEYQVS